MNEPIEIAKPKLSTYLSRTQAAKLLGIHPSTVYRWGQRGLLTQYRTPAGRIKYSADELRTVLNEVADGQ